MSVAEFEGVDHLGAHWQLSEAAAGDGVLLVFLPAAFTPTCTGEIADFAASRDALGALAFVTCDPRFSLRVWAEQVGVDGVPFVSDFWPHGALARSVDAFSEERGTSTRSSVFLTPDLTVGWRVDSPWNVARDITGHVDAVARCRETFAQV